MKMLSMPERIVYTCLALLGLLIGCSDENEKCVTLDVTCDREAKADVSVEGLDYVEGDTIELNVQKSIYDKIHWYLNGHEIDFCKNKKDCSLIATRAGTYQIRVDVTVEAFYGLVRIPKSSDSETEVVAVRLPTSREACRAAANNVNGTFMSISGSTCVIMETSDRAACRGTGYDACLTPENAQNVCTGDWRLPTRAEWIRYSTQTSKEKDANQICVQDQGKSCTTGDNTYPLRYVLEESYPDDNGVGAFIEYEFLSIFGHLSKTS